MKMQKEYPGKSRYFPYDDFKKYVKGSVLEIGCAEGNNTRFLKDKYGIKDMYCIELDIGRLEKAKSRVKANFVNADARWLPFKNSAFDSVYCSEVIEHLPTRKFHPLLVYEIKRVLKQGRYCIITTPNRWLFRIFSLMTFSRADKTHKSEISHSQFKRLVSRSFKNFRIIGVFGIFSWLMKIGFVRGLHDRLMGYPYLCKALVAVCRKE